MFFVPIRWRFVREATASARFIDAAEDLDLFALRALARQPMYVLAKISDDPAGAWRARDPEVVTALAALELRDCRARGPGAPQLRSSTRAASPGVATRNAGERSATALGERRRHGVLDRV